MKKMFPASFILLAALSFLSLAQTKKADDSGTFSLYFENDTFAGTDRCFTGGFKLGWMSGNLKNYQKNPLLRWLPFVDKPEFQHTVSISFGQNIYTPDDINRSDLIVNDRPYAGILFFAIGIHSICDRRADTLEFNLGIIGPHSYAEWSQKFIHKLINGVRPEGWHHQLKGEFVLGTTYERKWKLLQPRSQNGFGFDFIPHMGAGLGNVYIYAGTGMQIRFGWNLPKDFGTSLIRPGGDCNLSYRRKGRFGIHMFCALDGKIILRNIFLDGNTLRKSHRVDKNLLTGDLLLGIGMRFGRFNLSYAYVAWTKKFKTEKRKQVFGAFNLSYSY